jgi:dihydroorotase
VNKWERQRREALERKFSNKSIIFEYIADKAAVDALKDKWTLNFAAGIKTNDVYIDQFLWHIFSYDRKPHFEREAADKAFIERPEAERYIFFQHSDDAYYLENAEALAPEDLAETFDVYVVNKRFNWTYIVTHESDLGAYYYHKKMGG